MKAVWIRTIAWLMTMVWIFGGGLPVVGQDAPKNEMTVQQELDIQTHDLSAGIQEDWQELSRISEQLAQSTDEDAKALRKRGREILTELLADLKALSADIVDREKAGQDVAAERQGMTDAMEGIAGLLEELVVSYRDQAEKLRRALNDASTDDQAAIREKIEDSEDLYDSALEFLVDETLAMEGFNLDTEPQRRLLTEHLGPWAELLAGRVMLAQDGVEQAAQQASVDPTNTEVAADLERAGQNLKEIVGKLNATANLMDSIGMDVSDYEQLVFQVTGEITTDLLSRDVLGGLAKSWARAAGDWVRLHGPGAVFKVLLFFGILVAFRILSKLARKVVLRAMKASRLDVSMLLERTALSLTGTVVMLFGLLVALSQVGVEVAPLLAGLGVAGFIIGFALQDTLGNFASGVMILLYRPYDVGDLVEAAGVNGKVKDMSLVSTTILTLDNQTLIIPNSKIWGDVIKNVTAQTHRRIDMVFGIGYADDIPKAERVLREILDTHDGVLDDPEPTVKLHNLGDSSVDFVVRPWVDTDDYWDVYWDITREVKMRFDAEGISIPFPQRDVHVFPEGGGGES